ncbi:MAG: hypothetical protein Q4F31_02490 [Eubacteriales bacterium]|nr:hypothetical protein [Eubacteriales bacterium]
MKKILCAVLALVLVLGLSVSAFAGSVSTSSVSSGSSVTKSESDGESTSALPVVVNEDYVAEENEEAEEENEVTFVDSNGEVVKTAPDALVMLPVDEAEKVLEGEELEAFEKYYEEAKAEEDYIVTNFFWLDVADEYKNEITAGNGLKLTMQVPGLKAEDEVKVTVNGNALPDENVSNNGDSTITACFYELGAVAIMTKAAA